MKPEYKKYLYQQELKELREKNTERERVQRVFKFIEDHPALVTSTIYDFYSVSNLLFDEYHRHNLTFDARFVAEMERIIQEYGASQKGLSRSIDELDSEYEL